MAVNVLRTGKVRQARFQAPANFPYISSFYRRAVWLCVQADSDLRTDGKEPVF